MKLIFLMAAQISLLLSGCAVIDALTPDDDIRGMSQQAADELIQRYVGNKNVKPSDVTLADFYEERATKTTNTSFVCNNSEKLNRITTYAITKRKNNYVEIAAAFAEDCDKRVQTYRLAGKYDGKWLFLKRPDDATTYVYAYEIMYKGAKLRTAFIYKITNNQLKSYTAYQAGEEISDGSYFLTDNFVSIKDLHASLEAQQDLVSASGRSSSNDTASQLALFGSLFAEKLQQQQATKIPPIAIPKKTTPPQPNLSQSLPAAATKIATQTNTVTNKQTYKSTSKNTNNIDKDEGKVKTNINQSTLELSSVSGAVNTATQNKKANKEKSPTYVDPNPYDMKSEWGMHPRYGSKVEDMWKTRAEACSAAQKEAASASKVNIVVEALSPCVCVRNLLREMNPYGPDDWQCSIYAKVKWVGGSTPTISK